MKLLATGLAVLAVPQIALAADIDTGDTAWILTSTALVLFMTLPGLALFYGGLTRSRNVLSVLMQCFVIAGIASIVWLVAGYSLAFTDGGVLIFSVCPWSPFPTARRGASGLRKLRPSTSTPRSLWRFGRLCRGFFQ